MKSISLVLFVCSALLFTACGGGGGQTSSTPAVTVEVVKSPVPDYPDARILDAFLQPAGTFFVKGMDGANRAFFFPTLYFNEPLLPGIEFIETSPDVYEIANVLDNVQLGNARDYSLMDENQSEYKRFVLVDHGLELATGYETWPFGDVWVATDYGSGFVFEGITQHKGFYHSVDAYDIDGNGYDEIMALNMGMHGGDFQYDSIHSFDDSIGNYIQYNAFSAEDIVGAGGAVRFVDLNNDGVKELVQALYRYNDSFSEFEIFNWGAIRVWELNPDGLYSVVHTTPREGLWGASPSLGCARIVPIDINNDGLQDLLFNMEGSEEYGIELYVNEGNFELTRVTADALNVYKWTFLEFGVVNIESADINNDGFDDIVFDGYFGYESEVDLARLFFINEQENKFEQYNNVASLRFNFSTSNEKPQFLRWMSTTDGVTKFFGYDSLGSPVVVNLEFP